MKHKFKKIMGPVLFAFGGAGVGFLLYYFFGCTSGCNILGSPVNSMLYMSAVGLLLSVCLKKEDKKKCNT